VKKETAAGRAIPPPIWFAAALVPMVASQIIRLQQHDAGAWIFWDYAGRLGGLGVLAIIPSARTIAFQRERLQMVLWQVVLWIAGVVLADHYLDGWTRRTLNAALPAAAFGAYPQLSGWLHVLDIVFGIALVAFSEEIVFRRCARHVFRNCVNDGALLVVITSLLFGAYHWWAGMGNVIEATIMGVLLMLFFRRSVALWPVVLGHYLIDLVDFA
jgi:uncharacterized protein